MLNLYSKILLVIFFALCSIAFAESNDVNPSNTFIIFTPDKIKWSSGPASLPKGVQIAVLEGDPKNPGPFTIRLKFPANYRILPHTHSGPEHVTVISGNLFLGRGDKIDEKQATRVSAGSFVSIQPNTSHYGFTKNVTIIQLHGTGPWKINYIDPKDDPRKTQ